MGLKETFGLRDHLQYAPRHHEAAISGPLRALAPVLLAIQVCWTASVLAAGAVDRAAADALFQADLNALAAKCDELEMAEQGGVSRNWFVLRDPRRHYLFFPPDSDPVAPAADASTVVRQWHAKFTQLRRQQAERLFELARQSVEAGDEAAAYRLLHEVLHEDPEHAQAPRSSDTRGTAGSAWRRTSRRPQRRRARGPHPLFGWSPHEYWHVDSEHFELTTDLHARAGQQVVALLERVYTAWQQLFYSYWSVPGRLVATSCR